MPAIQTPSAVWPAMRGPECTKIARFSAVAAAILTAPPQNRTIFKAPRCAISSAKEIASDRRFSLRLKGTNFIPTAEFTAIPESAAKIASERRCTILVHSGEGPRCQIASDAGRAMRATKVATIAGVLSLKFKGQHDQGQHDPQL